MKQMLLLPDPRPLVERLGADFFRQAQQAPGVYLMRDGADTVLYVGKARNLRQRLASYRIANPDRVPRRHLRLLRAVRRIELQECASEQAALARESELLRHLRPRFNRAGTWPGTPRVLGWRTTEEALEFAVTETIQPGWRGQRPLGAGVYPLRAALVRLLWCAVHPDRGLTGMPEGWFSGRHGQVVALPRHQASLAALGHAEVRLDELLAGRAEPFVEWVNECCSGQTHSFEVALREADLETVTEFAERWFSPE